MSTSFSWLRVQFSPRIGLLASPEAGRKIVSQGGKNAPPTLFTYGDTRRRSTASPAVARDRRRCLEDPTASKCRRRPGRSSNRRRRYGRTDDAAARAPSCRECCRHRSSSACDRHGSCAHPSSSAGSSSASAPARWSSASSSDWSSQQSPRRKSRTAPQPRPNRSPSRWISSWGSPFANANPIAYVKVL